MLMPRTILEKRCCTKQLSRGHGLSTAAAGEGSGCQCQEYVWEDGAPIFGLGRARCYGALLFEKAADVNAQDHCGETLLMCAAPGEHEAMVRLLLDKGADVNSQDHFGETVLMCAVQCRYEA